MRRITYLTASQASVAEFTSDYDAVGNVVAASDNGTSASYTYDALNRLIAAGDERFTYDAVGNRVSSDGEVDAADQLVGLAHDGRGNPLEGPQGERYTWDAAGRLTSVELADGSRVDYGYDGRGGLRTERRRDVAGAESTRRLTLDLAVPLPSVLAENGPEGTTEYIYGLGLRAPGTPWTSETRAAVCTVRWTKARCAAMTPGVSRAARRLELRLRG